MSEHVPAELRWAPETTGRGLVGEGLCLGTRIPNPEPSEVKHDIAESYSKIPPSSRCPKEMWHEEQLHNRLKHDFILWGWTLGNKLANMSTRTSRILPSELPGQASVISWRF